MTDAAIDIHDTATLAARKAAEAARPIFGCGFAWVDLSPATHPYVRALRKANIGHKGYKGGWTVWNPSKMAVQEVNVLEAGAVAYAQTVRDLTAAVYGQALTVSAGSRLD